MSAKASGADTGGSARNREHNQGNQGRSCTPEQAAAVIRIRKCSPTAFYDILALEAVKTTCSDSDIKKAYRKQSLLTHPDKNGHEHADEAFKMVSRAFGILGDKEKREKFDKFGGDPDSRFGGGPAPNPFSGFRQASGFRPGGGMGGMRGGMFDDDISPEEMFARFFGGGGGFGGGGFGGPEFVFNFGGGPGIRVHQFGGGRPQRRPRAANGQNAQQDQNAYWQNLMGLLPIILFFVLPMLSSIFSGATSGTAPVQMQFDVAKPPFTYERTTPNLGVHYFVRESDVAEFSGSKLRDLDQKAEVRFVQQTRNKCEAETTYRRKLWEQAQGWFYQDPDQMQQARDFKMPSCERLDELKIRR